MKKVGQFLFTFIPLVVAVLLQFLVGCYCVGIAFLASSIYSLQLESGLQHFIPFFQRLSTDTMFSATLMMNYSLFAMALFGIWYYCCYGGVYRVRLSSAFHPVSLLGILMLVPGAQFVTSYIVTLVSLVFPSWLETYEKLLENSGIFGSLSVPLAFYGTLFGPIAEELIFRGVTLRQAQKTLPFWAANIMQALIFGIYHMNLLQGTYAFFVGLLLGYICRRGKIHSSILLHILFNAWALFLSGHLKFGSSPTDALIIFLLTIALFLGGIICFTAGTNRLSTEES